MKANEAPEKLSKIVNIEENMPHKVSEVICVRCDHRWIAARPAVVRLRDLECPGCGGFGGVIETGEVIEDYENSN